MRYLGDPVLAAPCKRLLDASDIPRGMLDAMRREMHSAWAQGLGLSANQVGASLQLAIARLADTHTPPTKSNPDPRRDVILINPRIVEHAPKMEVMVEGCLSVPNVRNSVRRYTWIVVEYLDAGFVRRTLRLEGMDAQIVQHEIDHLAGRLITSGASRQMRRQAERHAVKFAEQRKRRLG